MFDYDLFVIGAGSGGLAASKQAASYGVRVAIAEKAKIGGVCINRGCIPKKLLFYASQFSQSMQDAVDYGWDIGQSKDDLGACFNWQRFFAAQEDAVNRIRQHHEETLEAARVERISSHVRFKDEHTLELTTEERYVTADKILIAVGGSPSKPPIPGMEYAITSREIFHLQHQPRRIAIIGGGYIGVEFANMMNGLGSEVFHLVRETRILEKFDRDITEHLQQEMVRQGINLYLETNVSEIRPTPDGLEVSLDGKVTKTILVDTVLAATGRSPSLEGLHLDCAGVALTDGKNHPPMIRVDHRYRTSQPHIFAIGDCIDRIHLTPVAVAAGRNFAQMEFSGKPAFMNEQAIPTAVFSHPQVAMVGMTEEDARQQLGDRIDCHIKRFTPLYDQITTRQETSLVKLIIDRPTEQIVGIHMIGDHASEIIQGFAVAMGMKLSTVNLERAIALHPSVAEELLSL